VTIQCDGTQQFLATAGGTFICRDGVINIISTRFVLAQDVHALMPALQAMKAEENASRQGEHQHTVDLTRTLAKRLKEWQEMK
jgi:F0F1-type ATP synthase epsilon subunit